MNIVLLVLSLIAVCASQKLKDATEHSAYVVSSWPGGYPYDTKGNTPISDKRNIETSRDEYRNEERYNTRKEHEYSYEGGHEGVNDGFPKIIGRQGLGFERRVLRADGLRRPITPEALEHIGKRRLLKELKYEPLL